ncbi:unnamed protein product [Boreogadus saida]
MTAVCLCVCVQLTSRYRRPAVGRPFPSYMMRTDTPTCDVTKGFHVAVDVTAYRTRKHTVAPPPPPPPPPHTSSGAMLAGFPPGVANAPPGNLRGGGGFTLLLPIDRGSL